jgi:hypothetical protein
VGPIGLARVEDVEGAVEDVEAGILQVVLQQVAVPDAVGEGVDLDFVQLHGVLVLLPTPLLDVLILSVEFVNLAERFVALDRVASICSLFDPPDGYVVGYVARVGVVGLFFVVVKSNWFLSDFKLASLASYCSSISWANPFRH